jgi:DNA mismatch repair protein MutS
MPGDESPSILFDVPGGGRRAAAEPAFFHDLNLDQVVAAILDGREEYDLAGLFYAPLSDEDAVAYRHEVFRDLEDDELRTAVEAFAEEMRRVRRFLTLAGKVHYALEKERWLLDAAALYADAVGALAHALGKIGLASRGFRRMRDFLTAYTASERFAQLDLDAGAVAEGLDGVAYTLRIRGSRVTVATYDDEPDYSVAVEETFARFRQGAVDDHLVKVPDSGSMDHVEARIAQLVARLHPHEFRALNEFCTHHAGFLDPTVVRFDREVQLYLAVLEHRRRLEGARLPFCYPDVAVGAVDISVEDAFDVALAQKLVSERASIVPNDLSLHAPERIVVVTGPNQGGKTTFARMVGQLHHLAALGLPVPGRRARLRLVDRIFTHFEREEDISTLRGKLDDELVRVRDILDAATGESLVILNEIFASTTADDAVVLGAEVLNRIDDLGCVAVCVTFLDELASLGDSTSSVVATVEPDDPSRRTFKVVRRPADGRAYAWAIAGKYGLSHDKLTARISQ